MVVAFIMGSVVIYLGGMVGLVVLADFSATAAFTEGVAPFLVGDAVKAAAAGLLLPGAWRLTRPAGGGSR